MMPTLMEITQPNVMPQRSRQEAARLLEELREAYRSLVPEGRSLVRMRLTKAARVRFIAQKDWKK